MIFKNYLFLAFLFVYSVSSAQPSKSLTVQGAIYELDQQHSLMDFTARHAGFGRVRGTFNEYSASMYYEDGNLEASSVTAVIKVQSLDTGNPGRDDHLKNVFFNVDTFPHIIFKSNRIVKEKMDYVMYGNLTIKDVTKEVRLPLDILTLDGHDQWENKRISIESSLKINRMDYNLIYDNEFWDGIVGEEIKIDISFGASHYNARNNVFPWRKKSIGTFIKNGVKSEGLEITLTKVRELMANQSEDYQFGINHFYRAGLALAQGGQIEEGVKVLQLAIEKQEKEEDASDLADLNAAIAEIYMLNNQSKKAKSFITAALKINELHPTASELNRLLEERF